MTAIRRNSTDEVFGRVVPVDDTLDYIEQHENSGWYLVATRSGEDRTVLELHHVLKSHGEVHHYQQAGFLFGRMVPLNLYFLRKP
ncbi:MAG: hypothetical protein HY918_06020 [Candidatus Doudnabacteria bacterium]|nr:hypothetical protein [Candidatus Doudnabacteria bacterium]